MKVFAVIALPVLLGVTLLPALLAGGDAAPLGGCGLYDGPIETILATIRTVESGGNYTAEARGSTASGAYQFIDGTWSGYGSYLHAADAPPEVQDAKAAEMVRRILDDHDGSVAAVPVAWYVGHVPAPGSPAWDRVPAPSAGNVLTPREYQAKWIDQYQQLLGVDGDEAQLAIQPGGCVGGATTPIAGGWSLPGPRELIDADPRALTAPHHDYPAWDWIIFTDTPIYAIRGGTVANTQYWARNWWDYGCDQNRRGECSTCGVGLTIVSPDGVRWTYCHGSNLTVADNAIVEAGQQIMWSGNTGRSGTPHLHVEIRVNGIQRCPQNLLVTLAVDAVGLDVADLQTSGCSF